MGREKGQATVEFAFLLPVFLLLLMGVIQAGWLFSGYLTLEEAAREGARMSATGAADAQVISQIDAIVGANGLTASNLGVAITPAPSNRTPGSQLTVALTYPFQIQMPVIAQIMGNTVNLGAQATMMAE